MVMSSLVFDLALKVGERNAYKVSQKDDGSVKVLYDHPNIKDEECTFTFYPDGSADCVSHAWGSYKTQVPAGTFKEEDRQKSGQEMANLYRSYQSGKKFDVNA